MAKTGDQKPSANIGDDAYEDTFSNPADNLKNKEETAVKSGSEEPASSDVKAKETSGAGQWKTTATKTPPKRTSLRSRLKGSIRHKSAFGFVLVVLVGGIWYSSIFAPNLLLVNIKDLFTNDLADATTALSRYTVKMIDHKLGKADCGDPETISCKLSTMSRAQVLTLKKHGFTVNGSKLQEDNLDDNDPSNDKPESRWRVSSIVFPKGGGTATDGASYARIASSSDDMRHIANSVWNPRSSFFMDVRYKERIKTQFDLTKNATVFGTTEKEVNDSFDESMQGDDEKVDTSGRGAYSLKTLASNESQNSLREGSANIAGQAHSYTNAQCGFYTQGKVVYNATQRAKETTLARFAMQYLKAADQIKAGLSDEITTNTLSGKLAWSSDGGYNGANATDASMYRHIVLREPVSDSKNGQKYYAQAFDAVGALFPITFQLMMTASATKGITGAPGNLSAPPADISSDPVAYCLNGQTGQSKSGLKPSSCPALTMAAGSQPMFALVLGALSGIAAASGRICPPPPTGVYLMNPTASQTSVTVMPVVAAALNSVMSNWADRIANDFTSKTKGVAASDAVFAGTGIILGDMAMSRGMQPASKQSLEEYLAMKADDDKEYEKIARADAAKRPFDVYNSYSFLGSLVRSVKIPEVRTDILGSISSVLAVLPSSIAKTTSTAGAIYNLQPAPLDTSRLSCPDAEYLAIGINADKGCNVRYSFGKKEMDANIKDVVAYMLKPHPDASNANIQDLQQRLGRTDNFEPQDPSAVQRMLSEAQGANNKPFIDKKTGDATKNSEYEKYLTYCVNRQDPWGRSALDVRREELSQDEKDKRRLSKDPDGNQITKDNAGSEYERPQTASYVAVTEGAKADQDWYTGKKCLDDNEMMTNFRAYTMACSVDGSFAGALDCTEKDRAGSYTDSFYTSNDIHYLSWF
jgi:hypothetical protein